MISSVHRECCVVTYSCNCYFCFGRLRLACKRAYPGSVVWICSCSTPPVLCQQKHPQTTPKNRTSLLASLTLCEMDVHLGRPDSVWRDHVLVHHIRNPKCPLHNEAVCNRQNDPSSWEWCRILFWNVVFDLRLFLLGFWCVLFFGSLAETSLLAPARYADVP